MTVGILLILGIGVYAATGVNKSLPWHNASQVRMANGHNLEETLKDIAPGTHLIKGDSPECPYGQLILAKKWIGKSFGDTSTRCHCETIDGWSKTELTNNSTCAIGSPLIDCNKIPAPDGCVEKVMNTYGYGYLGVGGVTGTYKTKVCTNNNWTEIVCIG